MIKELKIVILTCFLFCNMSCKEEADILDSGSKERAYIFFEFQGGFEADHVEISVDKISIYSNTITTDINTDLADRCRAITNPGSHGVLININNSEIIHNYTFQLSDSLILSVINDTLNKKLLLRQIPKIPDYPYVTQNDFQHLEITYLFGQGHSDLMTPVIPDPVSILAAFEFRNTYDKKIVAGIYPEEAFLYLLPGGELIETMQMDLWYEIYIYPGQTDTVTFYRLRTDPAAFEPPCGDSIYFKINLRDQFYRGLQIATDTIKYECDA